MNMNMNMNVNMNENTANISVEEFYFIYNKFDSIIKKFCSYIIDKDNYINIMMMNCINETIKYPDMNIEVIKNVFSKYFNITKFNVDGDTRVKIFLNYVFKAILL